MTVPFVQAKYYRPQVGRRDIKWIILHDEESPETNQSAEQTARFFANGPAGHTSAHETVDNDSVIECVHANDIAYHCGPTGNKFGWGLEQSGYAKQTRAEWLDAYGDAMLNRVAERVAIRSVEYAIPLEFVNAAGLRAGNRGVTTHYEISQAFGESEHWDPGTGYPIDVVLDRARAFVAPAPRPIFDPRPAPPNSEDINMMANDPISGGNWTLDQTGAIFANDGAPYCEAPNNHPAWNAANPNANHDWGLNSSNGHFTGIAFWKGDGTDQHGNGYVIGFRFNNSPQPNLYHFDRARTGKS